MRILTNTDIIVPHLPENWCVSQMGKTLGMDWSVWLVSMQHGNNIFSCQAVLDIGYKIQRDLIDSIKSWYQVPWSSSKPLISASGRFKPLYFPGPSAIIHTDYPGLLVLYSPQQPGNSFFQPFIRIQYHEIITIYWTQ